MIIEIIAEGNVHITHSHSVTKALLFFPISITYQNIAHSFLIFFFYHLRFK